MNLQKALGNRHFLQLLTKNTKSKQCVFQGNVDENNRKDIGSANELAKNIN